MKYGMKEVLSLVIMTAIAFSCSTPQKTGNNGSGNAGALLNTLSDQQKQEGWQLLFDGKSTSGWHNYGGKPVGSDWKVADGMLFLDTTAKVNGRITRGGNLVSDEAFEDFHLSLEWKISPKGNSGIMFYVHEDTGKFSEPYMTGPEMQVLDNDGHDDGKYPKHRAGDLYDLISCTTETVKPVGTWNLAEIRCKKGKLEMYLNGTKVISTTMWDESWKKLVEGSKFKSWPGFGNYKKGKISLQDHGDMVSYRNIMIRKL